MEKCSFGIERSPTKDLILERGMFSAGYPNLLYKGSTSQGSKNNSLVW